MREYGTHDNNSMRLTNPDQNFGSGLEITGRFWFSEVSFAANGVKPAPFPKLAV
jgi:hypothetical protein